jgi:uncharacterized protein involved in exopolysaccharide biosynthesis
MTLDLRFYIGLFLRRLPYVLLIVGGCTAIAVLIAFSLPPVFRAEARLLFESAQIPDELAATTVRSSGEENLLAIQQNIMTRASLQELAERFDIYSDASEVSAEIIIDRMRGDLVIDIPRLEAGNGVIWVTFGAANPETSAAVVNAVVDDILEQNFRLRTAASGNTLEFFEQEVRRLADLMALQNAKVLEFEEANRDALPESLQYRRSRQAAQQERLLQVDRELASLRDRRQRLAELYDRTGRLATGVGDMTPEQAQLEQVRQELASALVVLSPTNPRVRALQTQVAALEEAVKAQLEVMSGGELSTFEVQMLDIDGQIQFLAEEKKLIEADLTALNASILATPSNAMALSTLTSDFENLRVQYDQAVASLANARLGDRIEVTDRGQRVSVIEPAVPPSYRAEPNRKLLTATGFGVGVVLSAALVFVLELVNRTIRRPTELVRALGITPFGTVPYLISQAERRRSRTQLGWSVIAAILIGPLLLLAILGYIMPLDAIFDRLADILGLSSGIEPQSPRNSG